MTRLRRDEGGWAVVTAMALMAIMMAFGLASLATVDTQQRQTGAQRDREATVAFADAGLQAQVTRVRGQWPRTSATAMPSQCQATLPAAAPADARCPDVALIAAGFDDRSLPAGSVLRTTLRDDALLSSEGDPWYDRATIPGGATHDANANGRMWLRADATVRGRTRSIVALVVAPREYVRAPRSLLVAGRLSTGSSTSSTLIRPVDGQPVTMSVRCPHAATGNTPGCVEVARDVQLQPDTLLPEAYAQPTVLSTADYDELRARAIANGTYLASGCPTFSGSAVPSVVYVGTLTCSFSSNTVVNSAASPGIFVIERGLMSVSGGWTFHGLVYHRNLDQSTANMISLSGGATVYGGMYVDYGGGVRFESGSLNLTYDRDVPWPDRVTFSDRDLQVTGWRELPST